MREVVRSKNDIDMARPLNNEVPVLLGQTTTDSNLQVWPRHFEGLQPPDISVELVVCIFPNTAGVQNHYIGFFEHGRLDQAIGSHQPSETL